MAHPYNSGESKPNWFMRGLEAFGRSGASYLPFGLGSYSVHAAMTEKATGGGESTGHAESGLKRLGRGLLSLMAGPGAPLSSSLMDGAVVAHRASSQAPQVGEMQGALSDLPPLDDIIGTPDEPEHIAAIVTKPSVPDGDSSE